MYGQHAGFFAQTTKTIQYRRKNFYVLPEKFHLYLLFITTTTDTLVSILIRY